MHRTAGSSKPFCALHYYYYYYYTTAVGVGQCGALDRRKGWFLGASINCISLGYCINPK